MAMPVVSARAFFHCILGFSILLFTRMTLVDLVKLFLSIEST